jgi:RES domain-containing protein
VEVYRLSRQKFAGSLSGKGAAIKGARWNSAGVELIYISANRSLAMAEIAVHFSLATLPGDYVMIIIFIPDEISIKKLNTLDLPGDWNLFPQSTSTQSIGDTFVHENKYCILQVPSSVTFGDFNFLINPNHTDCKRIKIIDKVDFPLDKRIFK